MIFTTLSFAQDITKGEKSKATAVTIKKTFGNINMELFAGVLEPYEPKIKDPLIILMEDREYITKIKYIKMTLLSNKKRLYLEGEKALANKNYSKIKIHGLRKIENKGFSMPANSHTVVVKLQKDSVFIDRIN